MGLTIESLKQVLSSLQSKNYSAVFGKRPPLTTPTDLMGQCQKLSRDKGAEGDLKQLARQVVACMLEATRKGDMSFAGIMGGQIQGLLKELERQAGIIDDLTQELTLQRQEAERQLQAVKERDDRIKVLGQANQNSGVALAENTQWLDAAKSEMQRLTDELWLAQGQKEGASADPSASAESSIKIQRKVWIQARNVLELVLNKELAVKSVKGEFAPINFDSCAVFTTKDKTALVVLRDFDPVFSVASKVFHLIEQFLPAKSDQELFNIVTISHALIKELSESKKQVFGAKLMLIMFDNSDPVSPRLKILQIGNCGALAWRLKKQILATGFDLVGITRLTLPQSSFLGANIENAGALPEGSLLYDIPVKRASREITRIALLSPGVLPAMDQLDSLGTLPNGLSDIAFRMINCAQKTEKNNSATVMVLDLPYLLDWANRCMIYGNI